MQEKMIHVIGWAASIMGTVMFISYIDQIRLNMSGVKGSIIQPAATVLNCLLWTCYGLVKAKKDWPIIAANIPGIILGIIALLTAIW